MGKSRLDGPLGRLLALLLFIACAALILSTWQDAGTRLSWPGAGSRESCLEQRLEEIERQRETGAIGAERAMILRQQAAKECN
ncbi:hypothetical protein SH611_20840 [Geminicoccaceae bacterium 1502E]|nr:hypothetical protein [Geminicoccaceae bacterium 1502E]